MVEMWTIITFLQNLKVCKYKCVRIHTHTYIYTNECSSLF